MCEIIIKELYGSVNDSKRQEEIEKEIDIKYPKSAGYKRCRFHLTHDGKHLIRTIVFTTAKTNTQ